MELIYRHIINYLKEAVQDTPSLVIQGPRQCGKSTASRMISADYKYLTFDDNTVLQAAQTDPKGFVDSLPRYIILDEIQRVPELFSSIKYSIDKNRVAGRFILTGSADLLLLPALSDSLAGRMEVITMSPLNQAEMLRQSPSFLQRLQRVEFSGMSTNFDKSEITQRIVQGGFPEALRRSDRRRRAWFKSFLNSLIQRDILDISRISAFDQIPKIVRLLANRTGNLLNISDVSKSLSITNPTVDSYVNLLRQIFLVHYLEPYHLNKDSRIVKSPKAHLVDTGMICSVLGISEENFEGSKHKGQLFETFVINEIRSQIMNSGEDIQMMYYRDRDDYEVDLVLETDQGQVYGIEVKSGATVFRKDFKGLQKLQRVAEDNFKCGIVLHMGEQPLPFGSNLWALPVQSLWS